MVVEGTSVDVAAAVVDDGDGGVDMENEEDTGRRALNDECPATSS